MKNFKNLYIFKLFYFLYKREKERNKFGEVG